MDICQSHAGNCVNMPNIKWWLCQVVPHPNHGQIGMRQHMVMGRTAQISNAMCAMKERLYSRSGGLIKTLLKIAAAHTLTVGLYHRLFGIQA